MTEFEEMQEELAASPVAVATKNGKKQASTQPTKLTRTVQLPMPVMGLDCGTTETRAAIGCDWNNPTQVVRFPAPVRKVPASSVTGISLDIGLGSAMRLQDNLNILYNQEEGYLVGAAAVSAGESIEPGRSKIDDAGVKLAAAAKLLGLSGEVAVCFSIPYVDHPTYEKSRRRMVEEYLGTEIIFSLFDEEDSIVPTQVYVLPEGLADLYWAQHLGAQFRGKASVVINKGHYSLDCTVVEYDRSSDSIQFNPKASVSLPKGMFQFAQYVCEKLEMPNSNSLRLVEALANPESTIFKYKDKQGFKQVDLAGNLPALKREFSEEVIKNLLNWFPEDININDIHLVGGGFEVFAPEVTQMFGEGGFNVNLIQPLRLSSVLSQFLFCQQMTAKSLSL